MDISKEIKRLRERIACYDSSAAEHIFKKTILDILEKLNEKVEKIKDFNANSK